MSSNYSILSVQIRPEINENISIGFLLFNESEIFFNYSKKKLNIAKSLLSSKSFKLLSDAMKNIEQSSFKQTNILYTDIVKDSYSKHRKIISVDYLNYLSRYNTNLLTITPPKKIDIQTSFETFSILFKKFVDEIELPKQLKEPDSFEVFKLLNKEKIFQHYNIEKELTSNVIPGLIAPVKIDMLGKNEVPVYVQQVNLDRKLSSIEIDLAQLAFLNLAYAEQNINPKAFVISSEPELSKNIKQKMIWDDLRVSKQFEYVDVSEAEKIIEYAQDHNVQPLFPEEMDEPPF